MKDKITLGLIVGTRGFFNPELAKQGRRILLKKLKDLNVKTVVLPESSTPTGAIETISDADKCANLFNEHRNEIDGIIVSLPNFGDESGIAEAVKRSALNVPILVHAEDDDIDKVDLARRRDSFCGKISVCNNFHQLGIHFTDTTYHTCKIESDVFVKDIDNFIRVCRIVSGLKSARIGQIGTRPDAFKTVRTSEKLLENTGITVVPVDLSEIIAAAKNMDNNTGVVKNRVDEIHAYGDIPDEIPPENVVKNAKLSVVMENWVKENEIDASAVQCWSSIENNYGCAACTAMSIMSEKLMPSACEVDIAGSVSMYTLTLASGKPSALLDWNNNYGEDRDMCAVTHCSNYPKSFMDNPIEISNLDILGSNIGYDKCFGALKGRIASGPLTFFRMDTDDSIGAIRSYLGEGEFTDDPFHMDGGIGICRISNLQKLMKYITKNGFAHHVSMVRGNWADVIEEAVTNYLGWDLYRHG